ncbi:MAG: hypothetical protein U0176_13830 [Bacteroidia bacterium]
MDFNVNELYAMELAVDGSTQYESATAQAWNVKTQAIAAAVKETGTKHNPGKFEPGALQSLSKTISQQLFNGTPMPPAELKAWAAGSISRSRLAFLQADLRSKGMQKSPPAKPARLWAWAPGSVGLRHSRAATRLAEWLDHRRASGHARTARIEPRDTMDAPAAGLFAAVNGLQIGVVQKFKEDKEGVCRVQVHLPAMGKTADCSGRAWRCPRQARAELAAGHAILAGGR